MLVSERIGQFFVDAGSGRDRLEYTEYGAGDHWVVLLHGQLMPRRMQQPLARALAAEGLHVVTLDLLGHGRSDRPSDPLVYSMSAFGEQVTHGVRRGQRREQDRPPVPRAQSHRHHAQRDRRPEDRDRLIAGRQAHRDGG